MPENEEKDKKMPENQSKEKDSFLSLSYSEMEQLLKRNRERAKKEREEFMEAYFASDVRYNIK